jgi:beta-glucosidase
VKDAELRARLGALDLEQKVRLLTGADFWALHPEPAAGLRRMVTSDGPAGVRGERWDERDPSANVPSPTALAATWDEARIERLGRLLAAECRRKGVDVLLAPTINLHRTPYGGRHFECFSEDPVLTARIGAAYVRGLQDEGVAATVKHFVANDSETERFSLDARVAERPLRELYLAPFEDIVAAAHPWAVMAAYNGVNGTTMTESPMLADVLKGEWDWDGLVMSDWYAARSTEPAGNAALDLAMPGPTGPWGDALVAAVREGRVSEEAVDEKVLRILRLAARVGALEGTEPATPASWSEEQVAAELRSTAAASFVLARSAAPTPEGPTPEGPTPDQSTPDQSTPDQSTPDQSTPDQSTPLLPLERSTRLALIGPNAAQARTLGGGSATVFPPYTVSPLDGLREAFADVRHGIGVRASTRVAPLGSELLAAPAEVRFIGHEGGVPGSELRETGAFNWMNSYAEGLPIADVAAVEFHGRLRAAEAGEHRIGCSGVGRFRLELDGREAFDGPLELPAGADPVEGIMRPPQHTVAVTLEAGQELDLVARYEPAGDASFDIAATAFQINAEYVGSSDDEELARAEELAREADVAVVVVGTTEEVESEGFDRDSLALPGRQDELVRRVAAANPRTVVVVNAGAPVLLPWADEVPAVLLSWFPGQEAGHALADVLTGAAEPGGRLPTTWPLAEEGLPATQPVDGVLPYDEGLFIGYRAYDRDRREPRYPFGHGLGYTSWDYLDASVADEALHVRLRNSGERRGREVVQVYASRPDSAVERAPRWLVGFAGVEAEPGEEVTATIEVPARALAHWDAGWHVEPGTFRLEAGRSSRDLRVSAELSAP